MKITVLYVDGCPNRSLARTRVAEAMRVAGVAAVVEERLVSDEVDATALGFGGSPTILIDGRDLFPSASGGLACRLYATGDGFEGAPSLAQLVDGLAGPRLAALGVTAFVSAFVGRGG